jgi:hypothetical protein
MSSYISFYGVKGDKKYEIMYFYSSHDIYSEFRDSIYSNDEIELKSDFLDDLMNDLKERIEHAKSKKDEYLKYSNGNKDIIDEALELQDYISDLEKTYNQIELFYNMLSSTDNKSETSFDKITYRLV